MFRAMFLNSYHQEACPLSTSTSTCSTKLLSPPSGRENTYNNTVYVLMMEPQKLCLGAFYICLPYAAPIFAGAYSVVTKAPSLQLRKKQFLLAHVNPFRCAGAGNSPQTPDFKSLIYCERQRDLSRCDGLN